MPDKFANIAVVSEDENLADRINLLLQNKKSRVTWQKESKGIISLVRKKKFDIVILTDKATNGDSQRANDKLVESITKASPRSRILFLVDPERVTKVASTLPSGTYQYSKHPVSDKELKILIESALMDMGPAGEEPDTASGSDRLDNMIGRAPSMREVYRQIKQAAASEIPVLILGETGTGKDLAAQIIHRRSDRSKKPFISINLGSLPSELVASELFGHEKGSFSGAIKQHQGCFERAHDGTVFLDEIDCINEKVRVSLLRLLDQKAFRRLGGSKTVKTTARLIAATNADLEDKVDRGEFREDLFYRLDVFRITVPPLRHRPEDIPLLIDEFVTIYSRANKRKPPRISKELVEIMQAYDWPGNIRELKNVIQRAVLISDSQVLKPKHLPRRFRSIDPGPTRVTFEIGTPLEEIERTMVLRALEATGNNRKEAAKLLGISRRVIYNKLKKHKID